MSHIDRETMNKYLGKSKDLSGLEERGKYVTLLQLVLRCIRTVS